MKLLWSQASSLRLESKHVLMSPVTNSDMERSNLMRVLRGTTSEDSVRTPDCALHGACRLSQDARLPGLGIA